MDFVVRILSHRHILNSRYGLFSVLVRPFLLLLEQT